MHSVPGVQGDERGRLALRGVVDAIRRRRYTPDVWAKNDATKIGYEVSVTRHFHKPQPLRTLAEIRGDILTVEKEAEGLLSEIIGGKASEMEHAIRAHSRERLDQDPVAYRKLSERLRDVLAKLGEQWD
jgi:hypothetical protein